MPTVTEAGPVTPSVVPVSCCPWPKVGHDPSHPPGFLWWSTECSWSGWRVLGMAHRSDLPLLLGIQGSWGALCMSMPSVVCEPLHCLLIHWTLLHPNEVIWQECLTQHKGLCKWTASYWFWWKRLLGGEKFSIFPAPKSEHIIKKKIPTEM